jgi:hypothetical protein
VLGKEDKNRRWPSDNEFEERWIHAPIYGSRACPVILECLEEQSGHHEPVSLDEATVEHVMPQTLTPEWEALLDQDQGTQHAEWLHTIGNLTLTGYNPELGNRSYSDKRAMYGLSHFELNRYFGSCQTWGPAEIRNRATSLFKTAIHVWPRPQVAIGPNTATPATPEKAPAGFHSECVGIAQQHLGALSKLSQTRYESGDGQVGDEAVSEKSLKMSRFSAFVFEHGRGLDISGCPEVVGMKKKSNKNCQWRSRWRYIGAIREGKTEIPVSVWRTHEDRELPA